MLSIIIPALNEEKCLSLLLDLIKKQDFGDYEIILSDADSEDKTIEIAKEYGCKIIKGGLPGKGRNEGAKRAVGELFFFLDADVLLSDNFIPKALKEFNRKKLDVASFRIIPKRGRIAELLFNLFYNYPMIILEKVLPHGGMGIIIKKAVFFKVGGFDEKILLGEDHYLVRRAAKVSKFGIIKSAVVLSSLRRFKKDGWIRTGLKYFFCQLHMIFIGPVKKDIFKYRFGHYFEKREK